MTKFIEAIPFFGSLLIGLIAYFSVAWLIVRAMRRARLGRFWATVIHGGASLITLGLVPIMIITLLSTSGGVPDGLILGVGVIGCGLGFWFAVLFAATMLLQALIGPVRSRSISRWYQKRQAVAAAKHAASRGDTPEKALLNAELSTIHAERVMLRPLLVERKRILIGATCIAALIWGGVTVFLYPPATVFATLVGAGIGQIIARLLFLILKDQRLLSRTLQEHQARVETALRTTENAR